MSTRTGVRGHEYKHRNWSGYEDMSTSTEVCVKGIRVNEFEVIGRHGKEERSASQ